MELSILEVVLLSLCQLLLQDSIQNAEYLSEYSAF